MRHSFNVFAAALVLAGCGSNISSVPPGSSANSQAPLILRSTGNSPRSSKSGYTEKLLHSFGSNKTDGTTPYGGLVFDTTGALYGTTPYGGVANNGTIFKLTPSKGGYTEAVVLQFKAYPYETGAAPYDSLIRDNSGVLYGTTSEGYAAGMVFKLNTGYVESIIGEFEYTNGTKPYAGLAFGEDGALYGTTTEGGASKTCNGCGVVFKVSSTTGLTAIHSFGGSDGAYPYGGLVFDTNGGLYGTTMAGGSNNAGTVFRVSRLGTNSGAVLYSFRGGSDGKSPFAGLVIDAKGELFGTTAYGGSYGKGTVFKLARNGSNYTETVLHSFSGHSDGAYPFAGLVADRRGALYGTTANGGADHNKGTVFKLIPSGSSYTEEIIHTFIGSDGAGPQAGLILGAKGALYGTTAYGGASNEGTAFELVPRH